MLEIPQSIKTLSNHDIADNLYHYKYNTKHLLSLIKDEVDPEDPTFLSAYRSFEGEVFENYLYEKLLRYAQDNDEIDQFVLKGYHQKKFRSRPNTISISEKQQIVYRTKSREISEFDALFTTVNNELYFVEMTLVKSVLKLRKRLRKKKALLEIIFPQYEIKSLIILNKGASGAKFPDFCTVWYTNQFSSQKILEYIQSNSRRKLQQREFVESQKMVEAHQLKVHPFKYYNTMSWITKNLRSHKRHVLDMQFLMNDKIQRYHDLYNKLYIGYIRIDEIQETLQLAENEYFPDTQVVVAIEKKYTDEIIVTYYIQKSRKKLYLYYFDDDEKLVKEKKDPYGITVTEVYHTLKMIDENCILTLRDINTIKKLLKESFLRSQN